MWKRLSVLGVAFACALAALPVGSALADTTIGQTGGGGAGFDCVREIDSDTSYVVPAGGGTVTSFSFQSISANAGEQVDFLILRPTGGSNYTVVGRTGLESLAGSGSVETFPADIPVQAGDLLGIYSSVLINCRRINSGPGTQITTSSSSDPNVGDSIPIPFIAPGNDVNESANLAPPVPTSKDQCKNGGWQQLVDDHGQPFRNQGQCVAWVNHNT